MKRLITAILASAAVAATAIPIQDKTPPQVPGKPKPMATVLIPKGKTYKPGKNFTAQVIVRFPKKWHGYQNPPTKKYQIPVVIESADKKTTTVVKVNYPKGKVLTVAGEKSAVYGGIVRFPVTLKAQDKEGTQTLKIRVKYQLCDDASCLPPDKLEIKQSVTIKK
jgi:DsbC/DsbD-like thiol-disulfide interchange protein